MFPLLLIISKSAKTAMLLTTFIPGGGQFYTQRYFKGIAIGGLQSYLIYKEVQTQLKINELEGKASLTLEEQTLLEDKFRERRNFGWWMALVWSIGILDAYVDAKLYGFDTELSIDERGSPKVALSLICCILKNSYCGTKKSILYRENFKKTKFLKNCFYLLWPPTT
jgi:hypothetical protein